MSNPTTPSHRVIVTGRETWSATEYRTLGRFRGSQSKLCAVKDGKGRPAERAEREIHIWIVCSDGVVYRFVHDETCDDRPTVTVRVHGCWHDARSVLPGAVADSHHLAARRVRACLRIMRREVAALPTFRPIDK